MSSDYNNPEVEREISTNNANMISITESRRTTATSLQTISLSSHSSDVATHDTVALSSRLELNDDDNDMPPLPIGMIESALYYAEDTPSKQLKQVDSEINESINELSPPVPFNFTEYEDDDDDDEAVKYKMDRKPRAALPNSSIRQLTSERDEMDEDTDRGLVTVRPPEELSTPNEDTLISSSNDLESALPLRNENVDSTRSEASDTPERQESEVSAIRVPEAFLVEARDETIYLATPILSRREKIRLWWQKQNQVTILLTAMFIVVSALSISLGVVISRGTATTTFVSYATPPSPSISMAPSSSPTECIVQIYKNEQQLDLKKGLLDEDPHRPKVAVDGNNMVVSVRDGSSKALFIVLFYTLKNDEWELSQLPFRVNNVGNSREVAISGTTAIVGYPYADKVVLVYEQNQFGEWKEMNNAFAYEGEGYLGYLVDIEGDLACVKDLYNPHVNLFRREEGKWREFEEISGKSRCSIVGDTIAISRWDTDLDSLVLQLYNYDEDLGRTVSAQDPILISDTVFWPWSMGLDDTYLVYWVEDDTTPLETDDLIIYHRDEKNQTFSFHQRLAIPGPAKSYSIALDNDILVVSGVNHTHIFSLEGSVWVETVTLDEWYDDYQISGRHLLATKGNEVHSFNIQHCKQNGPTFKPTMSLIPTTISESPSTSSHPTSSPSTSLSPSDTCYLIQVAIVYDALPAETSFQIQRVNDDGGEDELVIQHTASVCDEIYTESLCLQEGNYQFTISDGDGICCGYGRGWYNVTSYGAMIVEGGEFEMSESTSFSIPFARPM